MFGKGLGDMAELSAKLSPEDAIITNVMPYSTQIPKDRQTTDMGWR